MSCNNCLIRFLGQYATCVRLFYDGFDRGVYNSDNSKFKGATSRYF